MYVHNLCTEVEKNNGFEIKVHLCTNSCFQALRSQFAHKFITRKEYGDTVANYGYQCNKAVFDNTRNKRYYLPYVSTTNGKSSSTVLFLTKVCV